MMFLRMTKKEVCSLDLFELPLPSKKKRWISSEANISTKPA